MKENYIAVANIKPKKAEYKAMFPSQAALLGFSDTGQTVEIKIKPEDQETITVPLWQ